MQLHLQSAGRRFLKTLGFSLTQAVVFGTLIAAAVFFRPPRASLDDAAQGELTWRQRLYTPLEALERISYDWRSQELGRATSATQAVALATLDEETLANAREDAHPQVATQPWPRELIGQIVGFLSSEGATLTLIDAPFPDLSPRGASPGLDDERFRKLLDKTRAPAALTFDVAPQAPPPSMHPLRPYLVLVGNPASPTELHALIQHVLAERIPAFVVPNGAATQVWAGVADEDEGKTVAHKLRPTDPALVRELTAKDRTFQVDPVALAVMMAETAVRGLDSERLPQVRGLKPPTPSLLSDATVLGFRQLSPDSDEVVRGAQLLVTYVAPDGQVHILPSAPLAAAMRILGAKGLRYEQGRLYLSDGVSVPMDPTGFALMRWDGGETNPDGRGAVPHAISAWRLVRDVFDAQENAPPHYRPDVKNRAVVFTDVVSSPWVKTTVGPGVAPGAVLAQSMANLLAGGGVARAPPKVDFIATFALAFAGAFLALTFSVFFRSLFGAALYFGSLLAGAAAYLYVARRLFITDELAIAVAGPLLALGVTFLATTLYKLRTERQMRDFVEAALGRYTSPEITHQVFRNIALMKPERRVITVCISDIAGFNRLLTEMDPEALVAFVNEYFTEMTSVIRLNGGQVHYVGDAILAFFGAPVWTERHAHLACQCALSMRAALAARKKDWEKRYGRLLEFRTGLYTGEVLVGDLGSRLKSNYTVMGEAVTLAERLESANRLYGTSILVGESTREAVSADFLFRELDHIIVRNGSMRIYELVGRKTEVTGSKKTIVEKFEKALLLYKSRKFPEAHEVFTSLVSMDPPSRVYVERSEEFMETPPPIGWSGIADLRRAKSPPKT